MSGNLHWYDFMFYEYVGIKIYEQCVNKIKLRIKNNIN